MSYFKQPFTLTLSNAVASQYALHTPVCQGVQTTDLQSIYGTVLHLQVAEHARKSEAHIFTDPASLTQIN